MPACCGMGVLRLQKALKNFKKQNKIIKDSKKKKKDSNS